MTSVALARIESLPINSRAGSVGLLLHCDSVCMGNCRFSRVLRTARVLFERVVERAILTAKSLASLTGPGMRSLSCRGSTVVRKHQPLLDCGRDPCPRLRAFFQTLLGDFLASTWIWSSLPRGALLLGLWVSPSKPAHPMEDPPQVVSGNAP